MSATKLIENDARFLLIEWLKSKKEDEEKTVLRIHNQLIKKSWIADKSKNFFCEKFPAKWNQLFFFIRMGSIIDETEK